MRRRLREVLGGAVLLATYCLALPLFTAAAERPDFKSNASLDQIEKELANSPVPGGDVLKMCVGAKWAAPPVQLTGFLSGDALPRRVQGAQSSKQHIDESNALLNQIEIELAINPIPGGEILKMFAGAKLPAPPVPLTGFLSGNNLPENKGAQGGKTNVLAGEPGTTPNGSTWHTAHNFR